MEPIDLFDSSQWIWGPHFEKRPNLYLGMYEKQLYVQENHKNLLDLNYVQHAKYPWRPYPAASKSIKLSHISYITFYICKIDIFIINNYFKIISVNAVTNILVDKDNNDEVSIIETNEAQNAIALSVLYNSEYINGE